MLVVCSLLVDMGQAQQQVFQYEPGMAGAHAFLHRRVYRLQRVSRLDRAKKFMKL